MSEPATPGSRRLRRPLFQKYFLVLFVAVVVPLLVNGASETWFGYRDQRASLSERLRAEAGSAAGKINEFLTDITDQLQWTVQLPWVTGGAEQHRLDILRLMRQVPAILDVTEVDGGDLERLHISRINPDVVDSGIDRRGDPAVAGARTGHIWYGPVTFYQGSEPHMRIAVAGARRIDGITVAVINLKLIWDTVSAIHVGQAGEAFVLDDKGRLIAHPDISLVLRGADDPAAARLGALRSRALANGGIAEGSDAQNRAAIAAMAPIPGPNWAAFVEEPTAEAFASIRGSLWRTGYLLVAGALFAAGLGYLLARWMTGPIRLLERGAEEIGAGNFAHKIDISTGDELEELAQRFNAMAGELAESQERSERIARLKRFLAPQVAELVERRDHEGLLDSHRVEVVAIFCDLRGFTSFASVAGPEEVIGLVQEYYEALGAIITRYEATLTCFMGDAAVVHPDGYVEIRDRLKDVIISGGENISSVEVEGCLLRHPAVQEVAVVGMPHERWGEAPHAFVVLRDGVAVGEDELKAHVRDHLAHFKTPQWVSFVKELPKTATGKVQKYVLRGGRAAMTRQ